MCMFILQGGELGIWMQGILILKSMTLYYSYYIYSKKYSISVGWVNVLEFLITYYVCTWKSIFPGQHQWGLENGVADCFGLKSHLFLKHALRASKFARWMTPPTNTSASEIWLNPCLVHGATRPSWDCFWLWIILAKLCLQLYLTVTVYQRGSTQPGPSKSLTQYHLPPVVAHLLSCSEAGFCFCFLNFFYHGHLSVCCTSAFVRCRPAYTLLSSPNRCERWLLLITWVLAESSSPRWSLF